MSAAYIFKKMFPSGHISFQVVTQAGSKRSQRSTLCLRFVYMCNLDRNRKLDGSVWGCAHVKSHVQFWLDLIYSTNREHTVHKSVFLWIQKASADEIYKKKKKKTPCQEENTSGGQIGNWIINYKEPRLSSAVEEKRDEMEVEKRKERTRALNKSSLPLSCPCRNSRCATWLKFPGLIAVK